VKLLLDTHVLLWAHGAPDRLGGQRSVLADPANDLLVSAATAWEISIKAGLGRLQLPEPVETCVPSRIAVLGARPVAIDVDHATRAAALPPVHRDPFDRMLVAQAMALDTRLVSADPIFLRYDVDLLPIPSPSGS
jgi:PIN domain nuclease of toxin-antitoxin system